MISSLRNKQIQDIRRLAKRSFRNKAQAFIAEGTTSVREALVSGCTVLCVVWDPDSSIGGKEIVASFGPSVPLLEVSSGVMRSISGASSPPGILAVCEFIDKPAAELLTMSLNRVVILAEVRDPGNAGTILRTSRAAGAEAVFMGSRAVDLYNSKLVRSSAGAVFAVPIARDVNVAWLLQELGRRNIQTVAAEAGGEVLYDQIDLTRPTALVVGNEAWGIGLPVASTVAVKARIPMEGDTESVNVGIAAAVFLFEAARQRRSS